MSEMYTLLNNLQCRVAPCSMYCVNFMYSGGNDIYLTFLVKCFLNIYNFDCLYRVGFFLLTVRNSEIVS